MSHVLNLLNSSTDAQFDYCRVSWCHREADQWPVSRFIILSCWSFVCNLFRISTWILRWWSLHLWVKEDVCAKIEEIPSSSFASLVYNKMSTYQQKYSRANTDEALCADTDKVCFPVMFKCPHNPLKWSFSSICFRNALEPFSAAIV